MDRLLSELTDWLIDNHAISSDDKELYEYAIYSFIISTVPLVIFQVSAYTPTTNDTYNSQGNIVAIN